MHKINDMKIKIIKSYLKLHTSFQLRVCYVFQLLDKGNSETRKYNNIRETVCINSYRILFLFSFFSPMKYYCVDTVLSG